MVLLVARSITMRPTVTTVAARLTSTSAPRSAVSKTPIQEWGYEYLKRQKASGRPISPHLSIYQPQLTWLMSGAHRFTGCAMSTALLVGGLGFAVAPFDFTDFINFVEGLHVPCVITGTVKFLVAYTTAYHVLNGIRFLGYDMAKGIELGLIYRSGYAVLALSTVIAVLIVLNSGKGNCKKGGCPKNQK